MVLKFIKKVVYYNKGEIMHPKGFTLIEMLVVVLIIGVLTAVAMPQYRKVMDRSKVAEALQLLPALWEARERWILENGYHWEENGTQDKIVDANGNQVAWPDLEDLDIEVKVRSTSSASFTTENWSYSWFNCPICNNGRYPVWVTPATGWRFGTNFHQRVLLSYNGRRLCCASIGGKAPCTWLNVESCSTYDDDDD